MSGFAFKLAAIVSARRRGAFIGCERARLAIRRAALSAITADISLLMRISLLNVRPIPSYVPGCLQRRERDTTDQR